MIFLDERDREYGALAAIKVTQAVNGERSVSGTIYQPDSVLNRIDRGWRLQHEGEYYVVTYAKPVDVGQSVEVSFDAVHQFFWDFSKSVVGKVLASGSHTFQTYLNFLFADSGYDYELDATVKAFRKENFGLKNRLTLFNDLISTAGLEFAVSGRLVRIQKRVGEDLSTIVRKHLNLNELTIEKQIKGFFTYQRGFGAWVDANDRSKGRLEVAYESPLAQVYGRLEAEPVVDERYTQADNLIEALKRTVENSYSVAVKLSLADLTRAGYHYSQPRAGDQIMVINETLGFQEKVRIVSFTSHYDIKGRLLDHQVTCNDIGTVKKQTASYSVLSDKVTTTEEHAMTAQKAAERALASVAGKVKVYYQEDFPVDDPKGRLTVGDRLFREVGDKTEIYYWAGSEWLLEPSVKELGEMSQRVEGLLTEVDDRARAVAQSLLPDQVELDEWREKLARLDGTTLTQADISVDSQTGRIRLGTVDLTAQNIATLLTMDKGVMTLLTNKFHLGAPSENLVKLSPDNQTLTATTIDDEGYYVNQSSDTRFWLSNYEPNPIKSGDELKINALVHSIAAQQLGVELHFYDKDKRELETAVIVHSQLTAGLNTLDLSLKIPDVPVMTKYYAIALNSSTNSNIRAVRVANAQVRIKTGIDMVVDGTITSALLNAAEGDFARLAAKFLQTEAMSAKIIEVQEAKIDELTVNNVAWLRQLISQKVLTDVLQALVVQADKIVIPGTNRPVFDLDVEGNLSVNTPFLKVNGEAIATERALREIELTPGPKGDRGEKGEAGQAGTGHHLFTTGYRYGQEAINQYSSVGYSGTWSVNEPTGRVRMGDIVQMAVYNLDKQGQSWVMGDVTAVDGQRLTVVSRGLLDKGDKGRFEGEVGGVNYFRTTLPIERYISKFNPQSQMSRWEKDGLEFDTQNLNNTVYRVNKVITSNGFWTVSFLGKAKSSSVKLGIDVCDRGNTSINLTSEFKFYQITVKVDNYTASSHNFVDFELLSVGSVILDKIKIEKGTIATDYSQAPEDLEEAINAKADQGLTQQQLNALNERAADMQAELRAKAAADEVAKWVASYQAYVSANDAARAQAEADFIRHSSRVEAISKDLGGLAEKWNFLDTYMRATNEGLSIGRNDGSSTIMFQPDRISMMSAGTEVMYISQGIIHIENGIFSKTIQIGRFVEMQYEHNPDINVVRYVGGN